MIIYYDHKNNFKVRSFKNHNLSQRFNKMIMIFNNLERENMYLVIFGRNQEILTTVNCEGELWGGAFAQ